MKLFQGVLILFFLNMLNSFSQTNMLRVNADKLGFDETFDKEIEPLSNDDEKHPLLLSTKPECLPEWFSAIPQSNKVKLYAIGISDPEMEPRKAYEQAYERALSLLEMMNDTKVSTVQDLYSESAGNKYEESTRFISKEALMGTCNIIDSFQTKFGEKIFLVEFDYNNKDSIKLKTNIDRYKSQTKIDRCWIILDKTDYNYSKDTVHLYYQYMQNKDEYTIKSFLNKDSIDIPLGLYKYVLHDVHSLADSLQDQQTVNLAHRGLWYGYFQSLLDNLSILATNQKSKVKSMNEIYINSNSDLTRLIGNQTLSFFIKNIDIEDNKLNVHLEKLQ